MVPQQKDIADSEITPLLHRTKELCSILISKVDGDSQDKPTENDLVSVHMLAWHIEENLEEAIQWNEGLMKGWTPIEETTSRP